MENIPNASATNIFLTSHYIFDDLKVKGNAVGSDRVFSLHRKEVHFETGFSLAVFSKTTKAEFMERGPRSAMAGAKPGGWLCTRMKMVLCLAVRLFQLLVMA